MASLILYNGHIDSINGQRHQALAIEGGRIQAVGTFDDIRSWVQPNSEVLDLKGRVVVPGFIDTHVHLAAFGASLTAVNLQGVRTMDELVLRCRAYAEQVPNEQEWYIGRGWDQNRWEPAGVYPTRHELNQISETHPWLLLRVCGHVGVANDRALAMVGVTPDTHIPGGWIDRDASGQLTGVLREAALEWFKRCMDEHMSDVELRGHLRRGAQALHRQGITSVHSEDSYDLGFSGDHSRIRAAYQHLIQAGQLPIRVYQKVSTPTLADIHAFLATGLRTGSGDSKYRIGPLKIWCDGTVGARTAALREPYTDAADQRGLLLYEDEVLQEMVALGHAAGMQMCLHAIGDRALEQVLQAYERLPDDSCRRARHRVVHVQVGDLSLYRRLAARSLIANIQAAQTASDWPMMQRRLGPVRESMAHAWRHLLDVGVCLTGGSDVPVESPNVFAGVHAAVTRQDSSHQPPGGWLPKQCLSVSQALKSYTHAAAFAEFQEYEKGGIGVGMLADLVVLDRDPWQIDPRDLQHVKVDAVVFDGTLHPLSRNS